MYINIYQKVLCVILFCILIIYVEYGTTCRIRLLVDYEDYFICT